MTSLVETSSSLPVGGYNVREDAKLYSRSGILRPGERETLSCQLCRKLLREPMQLISCGCRYCKSCIKSVMAESKSSGTKFQCPRDKETFTKSDVRNDRGCQKEIDSLEVDCPTKPSPCTWKGSIKLVEEHQNKECPNAIIGCKLRCGVTFPRRCQEWHVNNECVKRPMACQYCKQSVPMEELQDHFASCSAHPVKCTYCQVDLPRRSQLSKHLDESCNEYEMVCPMKETTGCHFKGKRVAMTDHLTQAHTIPAFETIAENAKEIKQLREKNEQLQTENRQQSLLLQEFEKRLKQLEMAFSGRQRPDFVEADCFHAPTSVRRNASPSKSVFGEDSGYDSNSSKSVSKLRDDLENQHSQVVHLSDNVQVMQESFTQFGIALDELRLRQDVLEVKTTNGMFIWKIPDIRRRYRDAVDRKTISLYSPPFYTSPHGYRMCIRVYLNGDGIGKGTHISMFFVLMKSEHDCLLSWPFKQTVRFTLINQVNQENSISEAFAPDLSSPSFQQPTAEMNVASGFPKFVRQSILQNEEFTKGNAIFIKAQVDLNGLAQH